MPDVGSDVGPVELLLQPRIAPQRGEMDQDRDVVGQFSIDSPAIRSAFLPILDGTQVVEKTFRRKGVHLIWYVDDTLCLGDSN